MQLSGQDIAGLLEAVDAFAKQEIAPLVDRPESPINFEKLESISQAAIVAGILSGGQSDEEEGVGLWENTETGGIEFSVRALQGLAEINAGVALHFHHRALAAWLQRSLGLKGSTDALHINLQGSYGLARHSLVPLIKGDVLDAEDISLLKDYFHSTCAGRLLIVGGVWQRLLYPVYDEAGFHWRGVSAESVSLTEETFSHGFDELKCYRWQVNELPNEALCSGAEAVTLFAQALHYQSLAQLAIATGALVKGSLLAGEYASVRKQGGSLINRHPAVQQMLAQIIATLELSQGQLEQLSQPTSGDGNDLLRVFSARALLHPLLCKAANQVVQVFGGIGYMRDTGAEKILRDVNQLKLMHGTPTELELFIAAWSGTE